MNRKVFWSLVLVASTAVAGVRPAVAACPYSSIQIRVQDDTSMPWTTSTPVPLNRSVHIGVFKNDWGVPVDPGTVQVWALQGSLAQPVSLTNGWEAWWPASYVSTWTFQASCGGLVANATAIYGQTIDVLSYILPGAPVGVQFSVITDKGNPWRTFSNSGGNVNERLPGFYLTKGNVDYTTLKAWNFEEMIYDSQWIYLVRDTSWTKKCIDNQREAGMLLFTLQNNQWVRGGRHFPRFVANVGSADTGEKFIQGVEKKRNPQDLTAQEGRWCLAESSGKTASTVRGELVPYVVIGGRAFNDVLKLSIISGSGTNDAWWFAKGIGFVKFTDGNQTELYSKLQNPYAMGVRIPCEPGPACM